MPRKNENAGPRMKFNAGAGAQALPAYFPPPLGEPKLTRGASDGNRRSR